MYNVYQVVVHLVMLAILYYVLDVQSDSNLDKENAFVVHYIVRNAQAACAHNVILAINCQPLINLLFVLNLVFFRVEDVVIQNA